jgi:hypothetical protein
MRSWKQKLPRRLVQATHHIQAVVSDDNTSSPLSIGWIQTEFPTPTSNVHIPAG